MQWAKSQVSEPISKSTTSPNSHNVPHLSRWPIIHDFWNELCAGDLDEKAEIVRKASNQHVKHLTEILQKVARSAPLPVEESRSSAVVGFLKEEASRLAEQGAPKMDQLQLKETFQSYRRALHGNCVHSKPICTAFFDMKKMQVLEHDRSELPSVASCIWRASSNVRHLFLHAVIYNPIRRLLFMFCLVQSCQYQLRVRNATLICCRVNAWIKFQQVNLHWCLTVIYPGDKGVPLDVIQRHSLQRLKSYWEVKVPGT